MVIVVATTEDGIDDVQAALARLGVRASHVTAPGGARRLVLTGVEDEWKADRLTAALRADGIVAVARPDAGVQLQEWVRYTRPISFGRRLSVAVAWSEHDRGEAEASIELGLGGFGNGQHPTTRMLIEQLVDRIGGGERVLDVGCGSGVLALCALGLGAASVTAVDVKPEAVEATRRNAVLNGMRDRVEATLARLERIEGTFDVVLANVGRAAVVELAPHLVDRMSPGAWLAVSGFSPTQSALVAGFLTPLIEVERLTSGDWSAIVLAHEAGDGRGCVDGTRR